MINWIARPERHSESNRRCVDSGERRLPACIRRQLACRRKLCSAGCRTPQASCLRSPAKTGSTIDYFVSRSPAVPSGDRSFLRQQIQSRASNRHLHAVKSPSPDRWLARVRDAVWRYRSRRQQRPSQHVANSRCRRHRRCELKSRRRRQRY